MNRHIMYDKDYHQVRTALAYQNHYNLYYGFYYGYCGGGCYAENYFIYDKFTKTFTTVVESDSTWNSLHDKELKILENCRDFAMEYIQWDDEQENEVFDEDKLELFTKEKDGQYYLETDNFEGVILYTASDNWCLLTSYTMNKEEK